MRFSVVSLTLCAMALAVAAQEDVVDEVTIVLDPEVSDTFELECGAQCKIACEFGNVLGEDGCPICECKPDPCSVINACPQDVGCLVVDGEAECIYDGSNPFENGPEPECGPVCTIFCEFGNVMDNGGCPMCECMPDPKCDVVDCSDAPFCPLYFENDAEGCPTCNCFEPKCPEECAENFFDGCNTFECAEDGTMTLIGSEIACDPCEDCEYPEPECRAAE
ncbi:hypothetical protein SARC_03121 [Sphaeroforma arctica JP610]|uniref:Antistasin-like domain-containing protein n=1 Tax=Sphaeroforma arctica JP610 TaxID=667725 RepID=A0A0L0G6L5_9EUKA|nr:hypothetical protein SARC_03121 [Sphaeroforma arctica JP610]KNC84660.1 hypothetical protein SARC_03121 [Sphaeroforma arctica JP610]|eukprot:XP_014158562.1 hypothetical protein SARC_03121 [Sphaeroforma arctica JP610]